MPDLIYLIKYKLTILFSSRRSALAADNINRLAMCLNGVETMPFDLTKTFDHPKFGS